MFTIYHNPRCRKSRAGLAYLQQKTSDFTVREYLKDPLTVDELKEILRKTGLKAIDLLRTQEEEYKIQFRGKSFSDEEWLTIIADHPKLLKRPLVIDKQQGVWADPPENMDILF